MVVGVRQDQQSDTQSNLVPHPVPDHGPRSRPHHAGTHGRTHDVATHDAATYECAHDGETNDDGSNDIAAHTELETDEGAYAASHPSSDEDTDGSADDLESNDAGPIDVESYGYADDASAHDCPHDASAHDGTAHDCTHDSWAYGCTHDEDTDDSYTHDQHPNDSAHVSVSHYPSDAACEVGSYLITTMQTDELTIGYDSAWQYKLFVSKRPVGIGVIWEGVVIVKLHPAYQKYEGAFREKLVQRVQHYVYYYIEYGPDGTSRDMFFDTKSDRWVHPPALPATGSGFDLVVIDRFGYHSPDFCKYPKMEVRMVTKNTQHPFMTDFILIDGKPCFRASGRKRCVDDRYKFEAGYHRRRQNPVSTPSKV